MFGLKSKEKHVRDIKAGEYVLLGGVNLLYVSAVEETDGLLNLVTEVGKLLFPPNDVLRVI